MTRSRALRGEPEPIKINVRRWRDRLPQDAWPPGFAESGEVLRADVFDIAARWHTGTATSRQLATAALTWGHGKNGYGSYRTRRVLDRDPEGTRLDGALEQLRGPDVTPEVLVDAYARFQSTSRLHGLGPAFFTKILYFAGYRRGAGGVQPLILDRRVAGSLDTATGLPHLRRWGWSAADWLAYLEWSVKEARRTEFDGEPDLVEISLFTKEWLPAAESS